MPQEKNSTLDFDFNNIVDDIDKKFDAGFSISDIADGLRNAQLRDTQEQEKKIELLKAVSNSTRQEPRTVEEAFTTGVHSPFVTLPAINEQPDESLFNEYLSGLAFNRVRSDESPETTLGAISNLAGILTTAIGVSTGLGKGIQKLGLKGATSFGARVTSETVAFDVLSEDTTLKEEAALTLAAEGAVKGGGALLKMLKQIQKAKKADDIMTAKTTGTVDEVEEEFQKIEDIGKSKDPVIDTEPVNEFDHLVRDLREVTNKAANRRGELVDEGLKEANKIRRGDFDSGVGLDGDELSDIQLRQRAEFDDLAVEEIGGLTDDLKESLKFKSTAHADEQIANAKQYIKDTVKARRVTSDQLDGLFDIKAGKRIDTAVSSIRVLDTEVRELVDEVVSRLNIADRKLSVGLKAKASDDEFFKRLQDIDDQLAKTEQKYLTDPEYIADRKKINELTDRLLSKDFEKRFSKDFPNTQQIDRVMSGLTRAAGHEIGVDTITKARQVINNSVNKALQVNDVIAGKVEKELRNMIPGEDIASQVDDFLRKRFPKSREEMGKARSAVTRLMTRTVRNRSDEFMTNNPDILNPATGQPYAQTLDALKKNKIQARESGGAVEGIDPTNELDRQIETLKDQFTTQALRDPQITERILTSPTGYRDTKLNLMFRALNGDDRAKLQLAHMDRAGTTLMNDNASSVLAKNEILGDPNVTKEAKDRSIQDFTDVNAWKRHLSPLHTPEVVLRPISKQVPEVESYLQAINKADVEFNNWNEAFREKLIKDLTTEWGEVPKDRLQAGVRFILDVDTMASKLRSTATGTELDGLIGKQVADMLSKAPDDTKQVYNSYRRTADEALDFFNKRIDEYNLKIDIGDLDLDESAKIANIPKRPGWFGHIWQGDYTIRLDDGQILGNFTDDAQAIKEVNQFLVENPKYRGKIAIEPKILATMGEDVDNLGSTGDELERLFSVDVGGIRKLQAEGRWKESEIRQVFFGNALERTEAGSADFVKDPMKMLDLYMYMGGKHVHFLESMARANIAADVLDTAISGVDHKRFTHTAEYIRTHASDMVGRPRDFEKKVDQVIKSGVESVLNSPAGAPLRAMGFTAQSGMTRSLTSALLTFGRFATIGMNPSTALINYSLLATNVLPTLGVTSLRKGFSKVNASKYKELIARSGISSNLGAATLFDAVKSPDVIRGNTKRWSEWVDGISLWMFNKTENSARQATLVAAREAAGDIANGIVKGTKTKGLAPDMMQGIADRMGKAVTDSDVHDEFAIRFMRKTNFDFSKSGLAEIFRNPAAKPFLQFKTFITQQLDFMFNITGTNPLTAKERTMVFGAFASIGGMMSLPGIALLNSVVAGQSGFSPKLWFESNFGEVLANGMPTLMGIDLSNRLTLDDLSFWTDTDEGAIFGIGTAKAYAAASAALKRDFDKAGAHMTPVAIGNFLSGYNLLTQGELRSRFSDQVIAKEDDFSNPVLTGIAMMAGFTTPELQRIRNVRNHIRVFNELHTRDQSIAVNSAAKAYRQGKLDKAKGIADKNGIPMNKVIQKAKDKSLSTQQKLTTQGDRTVRDEARDLFDSLDQ